MKKTKLILITLFLSIIAHSAFSFSPIQISNQPPYFVITGGDGAPWLVVNNDATGNNWSKITGFGKGGNFDHSSCTHYGENTVCIATGMEITDNFTHLPLLAFGRRGGNWTKQPITDFTGPNSHFYDASCTGVDSNATCIVAGSDETDHGIHPLLITSNNGGSTWTKIPSQNFSPYSFYRTASCSGNSDGIVCIAAGGGGSQSTPLLSVGKKQGTSWSQVPVEGSGVFFGSSCSGNGKHAVCVAVGQDVTNNDESPLLVSSSDGGKSWTKFKLNNLPVGGRFNTVSCTGNDWDAICVAGGQNFGAAEPLVVSTNGGVSWSNASIDTTNAQILSTSCSGVRSKAVCIAAGRDLNTSEPVLFVSNNGAINWTKVNTSDFAKQGVFIHAKCRENGLTSMCIADGQTQTDDGDYQSLLVVSTDGGVTWKKVTTSALDKGLITVNKSH